MKLPHLAYLFPLLAACGKNEFLAETLVEGLLEIDTVDTPLEVRERGAFGFHGENASGQERAILYVTGPGTGSCELVASYLRGDTLDPSLLWEADDCNLVLTVDYAGSPVEFSSSPEALSASATPSLTCQIGDGAFVYEQRGSRPMDWYWSGRTWQAMPMRWSLALSGGLGEPLSLDLELDDYQGGFIYELDNLDADGTGRLAGHAEAEWCEGLAEAAVF
jgi:hypothetical protein